MSQDDRPIRLDDIIEGSEGMSGRILSAPLVCYDSEGVLRYVTAWDVHTTEDEEEGFSPSVTSTRLVFKFGDIANV